MIGREARLIDEAITRVLERSKGTECQAAAETLAAVWATTVDEIDGIYQRFAMARTGLDVAMDELQATFGCPAPLVSAST